MFFIGYNYIEEIIFNGVKGYFEKLPPGASDDYKNGFYDLVAQYGSDGEDYVGMNFIYEDLIESTIEEEYNKFTNTDKKELQVFYEREFLDNYYDEHKDDYIYTNEDLINEITGRFKGWMDDNYSMEALLEGDEVDEEEDEEE